MRQTKEQLETWYAQPDPWGYKASEADQFRLAKFLEVIHQFGPYKKLLDIGAGEGFLTSQYPVPVLHGYELSDAAAARFPANVHRAGGQFQVDNDYDLVVATGVFYEQYDWSLFLELIKYAAAKHVLVSSIAHREHCCVNRIGKTLLDVSFDYGDYTQRLRLFEVSK